MENIEYTIEPKNYTSSIYLHSVKSKETQNNSISKKIILAIILLILFVFLCIGIRYIYFELKPFVIWTIEDITGYNFEFGEIKTNINNDIEINNLRLYSRNEGDILKISKININPQINRSLNFSIEGLISSIGAIELSEAEVTLNDKFFESKLFKVNPSKNGTIEIDVNKLNLTFKIKNSTFKYFPTFSEEYSIIENLDLELYLEKGIKTLKANGYLDMAIFDLANLVDYKNPGFIKQKTNVKIALSDYTGLNNFKGSVLIDEALYGDGRFRDIALGVNITEKDTTVFTIDEQYINNNIIEYIPTYFIDNKTYNKEFPDLKMVFDYSTLTFDISIEVNKHSNELSKSFVKLYENIYVKSVIDILQILSGLPKYEITHPYGYVKLLLDFSKSVKDPDYFTFSVGVKSHSFLHPNDDLNISANGNLEDIALSNILYTSDKVGSIRGDVNLSATEGLSNGFLILDDFLFLGVVNLDAEIKPYGKTDNWEKFLLSAKNSKWSLPSLKQHSLSLPPLNIDISMIKNDLDISVYVNNLYKEIFPATVDLSLTIEKDKVGKIPIKANINGFNLLNIDKIFPTLIKDSSSIKDYLLNASLTGFIDSEHLLESELHLNSALNITNGYKEAKKTLLNLKSNYKGNILTINDLNIQDFEANIKGHINFNDFSGNISAYVNKDLYQLYGKINPFNDRIDSELQFTFPDKSKVVHIGTISFSENLFNIASNLFTYSTDGVQRTKASILSTIEQNKNINNEQRFIVKANYTSNDLNLSLNGFSDFQENGLINSEYTILANDINSKISLNLNTNEIAKSTLKINTLYNSEDLSLNINNVYESELLKSVISYKQENTNLKIYGQHKIEGIGIDGDFEFKSNENNRLAIYSGKIYIENILDFQNIFLNGIFNIIDNDFSLTGKINFDNNNIGFKGDIGSSFGKLHLLAGFVSKIDGFNINAIGNFNDIGFNIKSKNKFNNNELITTNEISINNEHSIYLTTTIISEKDSISINRLSYLYRNLKDRNIFDEGNLTATFKFSQNQYKLDLIAQIFKNNFIINGNLDIHNNTTYISDVIFNINDSKYRLKFRLDTTNEDFITNATLITPKENIKLYSHLSIFSKLINIRTIDVLVNEKKMLAIKGSIGLEKSLEPNLSISYGSDIILIDGIIGIFSLPNVPINLNISISNDGPYNINGSIEYTNMLNAFIELTKRDDEGFYYLLKANTTNFSSFNIYIKTGKNNDAIGILASLSPEENGFIYSDVSIENTPVRVIGGIKLNDTTLTTKNLAIYNGKTKLTTLYGNIYLNPSENIKNYLDSLLSPPKKAIEIVAGDFVAYGEDKSKTSFTTRIAMEGNNYYASLSLSDENNYKVNIDNFHLEISETYSLLYGNQIGIKSDFSPIIYLLPSNGRLNLGDFKIKGNVGGKNPSSNLLPIDINISSIGIKSDTQLKILSDISLVLSQTNLKLSLKDEDDSYNIFAELENISISGSYGNDVKIHNANVRNTTLKAMIKNDKFIIAYLGMKYDLTGDTYNKEQLPTQFASEGSLSYSYNTLNIDINGRYGKEELAATGNILIDILSGIKLNSKNLKIKFGKNNIELNGFVNFEKGFTDISTNITINDFPIFTEGKISFKEAYIYSPSFKVVVSNIEAILSGSIKPSGNMITTNIEADIAGFNGTKIKGDIEFADKIFLKGIYLINKDLNLLLNGFFSIQNNIIDTHLLCDTGNNRLEMNGSILLEQNKYTTNINAALINLNDNSKNTFAINNIIEILSNEEIGFYINTDMNNSPLFKLEGNVLLDNKEGRFSTNGINITVGNDFPIFVKGYVKSNETLKLLADLEITFNNQYSTIAIESSDLQIFDIFAIYDKHQSPTEITSKIAINRNNTISLSAKVKNNENSIETEGIIIPIKNGLSLSDFEIFSNKKTKLLDLNANIFLNENILSTEITLKDTSGNFYLVDSSIDISKTNPIKGKLSLGFNDMLKYTINDAEVSFNNEHITAILDSYLEIPYSNTKSSRIEITSAIVDINLPSPSNKSDNLKLVEATLSGIRIDNPLWITNELYINRLNSDLLITLTLDKDYELELSAPYILTDIVSSGNPNIETKINAEKFLLDAKITNEGFAITSSSIYIEGSAIVIDDKSANTTTYNLKKSEIQYNNNKFIFDLFIEDNNKNIYTLKGDIDYIIGNSIIKTNLLSFISKDLTIDFSGINSIIGNNIGFNNIAIINNLKSYINGNINLTFEKDIIGINSNGLILTIADNKIDLNGKVSLQGNKIQNNLNISLWDINIGLKGSINLTPKLTINQTIAGLGEPINVVGKVLFENNFIKPQIDVISNSFEFSLTGALTYIKNSIKFYDFGVKSINYEYIEDKGFIYTTTGNIAFLDGGRVKIDIGLNDGKDLYTLLGLIINNSSTQTVDADLNIGYDNTKEAFLKASVNYKTLSMRANALIENLNIYTNGNIENDKAFINLVIKEQQETTTNNKTQGKSLLNILSKSPSDEHTIATSDLEIDLKTFDIKLNLNTDSLTYKTNISLSPIENTIYPKITKPYFIYTDGTLELNDDNNPLKLKISSAHNTGVNGFLLDNLVRVTLPDNTSINVNLDLKLAGLWIIANGDVSIFTKEAYPTYNDPMATIKYNTEIAFSEKGAYGRLSLDAFGVNLYYGGIVSFIENNLINLDGSIKLFGTPYLVNGNLKFDDKDGLKIDDFRIFADNMSIAASGNYNFNSPKQDIYLNGNFNETPYSLTFSLNGRGTNKKFDQTNIKTHLKPELILNTWGEALVTLRSDLIITEEMLTYDAIINDTINLFARYNSDEDFMFDISHKPINFENENGNSFNLYTNSFNISGVGGDIRTRISVALRDFIDINGKDNKIKIELAAAHEIKNTSLTKIAKTFSEGNIRDIFNTLIGFEIQNAEINWKGVSLFKASGVAKYNANTDQLLMTLNDNENKTYLKVGYDYNIPQIFINAKIDGYDLLKVMDNLKFSAKNERTNKIYSEINITGASLFDFEISNSYFRIDELITVSKDNNGTSTTSSFAVIIDEIIKNKSTEDALYVPTVKVIFNPMLYSLLKPSMMVYNLKYKPNTKGTDLISYFSQILDGTYSLKMFIFQDKNNTMLAEDVSVSFSNRLLSIFDNLFSMRSLEGFYGVVGSVKKFVYTTGEDFIIGIQNGEITYYKETAKIKGRINFLINQGIPIGGQLNVSGFVIDGYGQIQLGIDNIYINNNTTISNYNTLIFVEENLLTLSSYDRTLSGEIFVDYDKGMNLNILYNNPITTDNILLTGDLNGLTPIKKINSLNDTIADLHLITNLTSIDFVAHIIDVLESITGNINLDVSMKGKLFNPTFTGNVELANGFLKIKDYNEPVKDVYAELILENKLKEQDVIIGTIDYLSINHYRADIYGSGEIYYKGFFNLVGLMVDVTSGPSTGTNAKSLNVNFKNDLVKYTGGLSIDKLKLETDFRKYILSGIVIPKSTKIAINPLALFGGNSQDYTGNSADSFLSNLIFKDFEARIGNNVTLEVVGEIFSQIGDFGTISFGDILLIAYNEKQSTIDNQILLDGSIGDFANLKIRGTLNSKYGKINYLNNIFTIERASVEFKPPILTKDDIMSSDENNGKNVTSKGVKENGYFSDDNQISKVNKLLGIVNETTIALLKLKARTYKKYIDNSPIKITLDYEGPIEKIVDNLFSSLKGDYYGTNRIGQLNKDELAVLLGISTDEYEKYKRSTIDEIYNSSESTIEEQQNFNELALDSVDNLFFQGILNNIIDSMGLGSVLPFTFSIYSSGFKNIFSNIFTENSIFAQNPFTALSSAFSKDLEILIGVGLPSLYLFGVPLYENLYIQGGVELKNFGISEEFSVDDPELYLKLKADIDIASGEFWLLSSDFGISYEPFDNMLDINLGLQYSLKYEDSFLLNTMLDLSYSQFLNPDSTDGTLVFLFNFGFGIQILFYF